jgi:hypothetical protein
MQFTCSSLIWGALRRAFNIPIPTWHNKKLRLDMGGTSNVHLSLDGVINDMIKTFPKLTCVSEFSILAWMPRAFTPAYNMQPFYEAAFAAFGSNLRKLSLSGEMEGFREVLHLSPRLPRLEELHIVFIRRPSLIITNAPEYILRDPVAPFINRHRCTIRSLSISSRSPILDLSVFFVSLHSFPILQRIALDITFDYSLLSDRSGLDRFIIEHPDTLQHVDFKIGRSLFPGLDSSAESYRGPWLTQSGSGKTFFSRLKTLKLSAIHPYDFLFCIRGSADTLTKLTIGGRFLAFEEVESLVRVFSHRSPDYGLRNLCINVSAFSPELVCLLARKLSDLRGLSLNCQEFAMCESVGHPLRSISSVSHNLIPSSVRKGDAFIC